MKICTISSDAHGRMDGPTSCNIIDRLPNRIGSHTDADVVIVIASSASHHNEFEFNKTLYSITKPVVVLDMMEYYGRSTDGKTHLFGQNHDDAWNLHSNDEWIKLHNWLKDRPPILYFKRELYSGEASDKVLAVEWPCTMQTWAIEDKKNFDSRPLEVFFNWGWSNFSRPLLQGQIFTECQRLGYEVISSFDHIDVKLNSGTRKWVAIHSPDTHRRHLNEIALRQSQSKMSISLPGAGVKCFRSTEHFVHTVPVKLQDGMSWSFPWVHGQNCLNLSVDGVWPDQLNQFLGLDLHGIYVQAQELAKRYSVDRYATEYIAGEIRKRL